MPVTSDTPAARSLALGRAVFDALRGLKWSAGQAVTFSGGTIDVSAQRRYQRGSLLARVRLAVFCDVAEAGDATIGASETADLPLASYTLGDDDRTQREAIDRELAPYVDPAAALAALHAAAYPHERSLVAPCHIAAPPMPAAASSVAGLDTTGAFTAIDAIRADLLAFDLDVIVDDLSLLDDADERAEHARTSLAVRAASCDLIHVVIVTAATMAAPSVRVVRTTLAGAAPQWIDIVQSEGIEAWAARVTSHYDAQFRRRDFERG